MLLEEQVGLNSRKTLSRMTVLSMFTCLLQIY